MAVVRWADSAEPTMSWKFFCGHWDNGSMSVHDSDGDQRCNAVADDIAGISAAIEDSLAGADYGSDLAARGITTVALDDGDRIVEYSPDGITTVQPD